MLAKPKRLPVLVVNMQNHMVKVLLLSNYGYDLTIMGILSNTNYFHDISGKIPLFAFMFPG